MSDTPIEEMQEEIEQLKIKIKVLKDSFLHTESKELKASINREIHMLEGRQKETQNKLEESRGQQ